MKNKSLLSLLLFAVVQSAPSWASSSSTDNQLQNAIDGKHRAEQKEKRDQHRNPQETLEFFGFKPDMTVVEVWPGSGWYTDILAPALRANGTFIAAGFDPDAGVKWYPKAIENYVAKMDSDKALYGNVQYTQFNPPTKIKVAEDNSADMVLTFRNVHNWYMNGDEESVKKAFEGFYTALKPSGILGVVEHRLPESRDQKKDKRSGYVKQSLVIKWAEEAGFILLAKSEINANPKDTADHERGVWTLPPRLRLGDEDKEKYLAIGESDRMTLKFMKPASK